MVAVAHLGPGCGRTDLEVTGLPGHDSGASGGRDAGTDIASQPDGSTGGQIVTTGGRSGTGATGGGASGGRIGTGGRAGSGGAAMSGGSGGGTRDAGVDRVDAGPDLPPSTPGTLTCGTESCNVATQTCCVSVAVGSVGAHCVPIGAACTGASLTCDEPADCPGQVCCFGLLAGGGAVTVGSRCAPRAGCTGITRFIVCRASSDCPAATPTCCNTTGVPICQTACAGG